MGSQADPVAAAAVKEVGVWGRGAGDQGSGACSLFLAPSRGPGNLRERI